MAQADILWVLTKACEMKVCEALESKRTYAGIELTSNTLLGILNANRKIHKRTDTDVAFTREYSRVSIFHRERECTN